MKEIIDLCLKDEVEDSLNYLDILNLELTYYKKELEYLESRKPYSFQKNKLKSYYEKHNNLENAIINCQNKIQNEYLLIEKMLKD